MTTTTSSGNLQHYIIVTLAYWGFTITDGALRMLVLLYFDNIGYTPIQIASLFLFYEVFGILTNLFGSWIGSKFGLKLTLYSGIGLQIFSLIMLSGLNPNWPSGFAVLFVMIAQAFSGIAKDLTKMSSKSAIRLVVPQDAQSSLFKWVAILTGSKNALKGIGFFVGSALLSVFGFIYTLWIMATGLFLLMFTGLMLPNGMGKIKNEVKFSQLFSKSEEINILSAARFFLFGSRDLWFVVGLPVFLRSVLGWSFNQVGGFLAIWVIGYGIVQSYAPVLLKRFGSGAPPQASTIQFWTFVLTVVPSAIAMGLHLGIEPNTVIIGGLLLFGFVFAFNSAVHSYLVLAFTDDDKVALNVGFYYMANSAGRLAGTVLSGAVYQVFGLVGCLWVSMLFVLFAGLVSLKLPNPKPIMLPITMKKVMFVCKRNSRRSQMAEAFVRSLGEDKIEVTSSGLEASFVDPKTVEVMSEIGIDISKQESKPLSDFNPEDYDVVISLCGCGVNLPPEWLTREVFEDWQLDDPEGGEIDIYRRIREEVKERVIKLIQDLS